MRMSRAGRKLEIKRALMRHHHRGDGKKMTAGRLARKIGMKSSTELKKMCAEMVEVDDEIMFNFGDDGVWGVMFRPLVQLPLGDRFLTINGERRKVASWVTDFRGHANV